MRTGACPPERPVREPRLNNAIQASVPLLQCLSVWIIQEIGRFRTASMRDALSFFPLPPSFHFLHPFCTRLINKTIRYRARYRRGNATFFFFFLLPLLLIFFFFFFAISIVTQFPRSIGVKLFRSVSCIIIIMCYIIFEFLNSVRIQSRCTNLSKKRKKKKERRYICISIKGPLG